MKNVLFVLGGNDGEMETIKNILSAAGISFVQPVKGWGEKNFSPSDIGLKVVEVSRGTCQGLPARPLPAGGHRLEHHATRTGGNMATEKATPVYLWRSLTDGELWGMAFKWTRAHRKRDMETLDILYSAWTHKVESAPGHWARLQEDLGSRRKGRRAAV